MGHPVYLYKNSKFSFFVEKKSFFSFFLPIFLKFESQFTKGRLSYHLCVECFSQLSFDSEVYTKSETAADFVYTS